MWLVKVCHTHWTDIHTVTRFEAKARTIYAELCATIGASKLERVELRRMYDDESLSGLVEAQGTSSIPGIVC